MPGAELTELTAKSRSGIDWSWTDPQTLGDTESQSSRNYIKKFTFGTGANAVNRIYAKRRQVPISSSITLDLANAVLTDFGGYSIKFDLVKVIYVELVSGPSYVTVTFNGGVATYLFGVDPTNVIVRELGDFKWDDPATGATPSGSTSIVITNPSGVDEAEVNVIVIGEDT